MRLNLRWSFAEDATFQHTSTLGFYTNFHSHPSLSRTKACPEFGTLSCPRCLEWGHWEDSCWAIDHVCERWLLWKMKMLQWHWQETFSVQVWLCWSHWGCSWCQGLQTGQQPTVKFHSSKIPSILIMMCFHSCPCREEPLWTLLGGSRSRTGFTIRPSGAGGR